MIEKHKPWRCKAYTDWVKSLPCAVTGQPADDPHHIKGNGHGGTLKASDILTMPLTRSVHDELHRIGWCSWEDLHGDQRDYVLRTIEQALRDGVLILNPEFRP